MKISGLLFETLDKFLEDQEISWGIRKNGILQGTMRAGFNNRYHYLDVHIEPITFEKVSMRIEGMHEFTDPEEYELVTKAIQRLFRDIDFIEFTIA